MFVKKIECENFRNIEHEIFYPSSDVNLIYGQNAQGKTNLIESIWLFTGCRSFRGTKDHDLIKIGTKKTTLDLEFNAFERDQVAKIEIEEKRIYTLNEIKKSSASKIVGQFLSVVFSPAHLSLVKGSPSERRKFLDIAISQLKPNYAQMISQYNRAVAQRNSVLKEASRNKDVISSLKIWEERVAFFASHIICQRNAYTKDINLFCQEIYSGLSSGKEVLSIDYSRKNMSIDNDKEEIYQKMIRELEGSRKYDLISCYTSIGPHRDDIDIKINNLSAKIYGSQGQQRSAALALKLAEAAMIQDFSNEKPVALLDDVMSELDESRQNYILNHIKDWQVFISCCDPSTVKNLKVGKAIEIQNGRIK